MARIEAARLGNFGDCEPAGDGVSEMRIHVGPGYRLYYMLEGAVLYLLLCGGDKSTQKADIARALRMASQVKAAAKEQAKVQSAAPAGRVKAGAKAGAKGKRKLGKGDA